WCPRCQTVLSDLEVEREEQDAEFVYIKYGPLTLGTVRPETKLGDTAVAVNPKDRRYKRYVGKTLEVPSVEGTITLRVVADSAVGPKGARRGKKGPPRTAPDRFGNRPPSRPADPQCHRVRRQDDRAGRQVRGPRPLRDAQAHRGGHAGARAHRPHRALPALRRRVLPLQ